jgi:hypothetical protein
MAWIDGDNLKDTFGQKLTTLDDVVLPERTKENVLAMSTFSKKRGSSDEKLELLRAARYVLVEDGGKEHYLPIANISRPKANGTVRFSISAHNVTTHLTNTQNFGDSTACFQIDLLVPVDHKPKEKKAVLHWVRPNRFGCLKGVPMSSYLKLADQLCLGLGLTSCELFDAAFGQYCDSDIGSIETPTIRELKTVSISAITFLTSGTYFYTKFGYVPYGISKDDEVRAKYCQDFIRVPMENMLEDEARANMASQSGTPLAEFVDVVKNFGLTVNLEKPTGKFIRDTLTEICAKYSDKTELNDEIKAVFKGWYVIAAGRVVPDIQTFAKTY